MGRGSFRARSLGRAAGEARRRHRGAERVRRPRLVQGRV